MIVSEQGLDIGLLEQIMAHAPAHSSLITHVNPDCHDAKPEKDFEPENERVNPRSVWHEVCASILAPVELSGHVGYCESVPSDINIDKKFSCLKDAIRRNNDIDVQDAMFDFGTIRNGWTEIPDEVVERLLTLLRSEEMYRSPYARHLLNFFQYESPYLTDRQKWLCIGFLNAHGDQFSDIHSHHVVTELRYGRYGDHLKMKRPTPQQWEDYQKMQRSKL